MWDEWIKPLSRDTTMAAAVVKAVAIREKIKALLTWLYQHTRDLMTFHH